MVFEVNFLAIFVASIAATIVGALWYGPLFGKSWVALSGMSKKDLDKIKKKGRGKIYFINFIATLVTVWVLAELFLLLSVNTIEGALTAGALLWLGFPAMMISAGVLWENDPFNLYLINAGYWLVSLEIMSIILVLM